MFTFPDIFKVSNPAVKTTSKLKLGGEYFKYPAHVEFNFDDIDGPEFGEATGLPGEISFLGSHKMFQDRVAYMNAHPKMMDEMVWTMVRKYRDFWSELLDKIYELLDNSLRTAFVILGEVLDQVLDCRTFLIEFSTLTIPLDLYADDMNGTDAFGAGNETGQEFDFDEQCENFRGGLPQIDESSGWSGHPETLDRGVKYLDGPRTGCHAGLRRAVLPFPGRGRAHDTLDPLHPAPNGEQSRAKLQSRGHERLVASHSRLEQSSISCSSATTSASRRRCARLK